MRDDPLGVPADGSAATGGAPGGVPDGDGAARGDTEGGGSSHGGGSSGSGSLRATVRTPTRGRRISMTLVTIPFRSMFHLLGDDDWLATLATPTPASASRCGSTTASTRSPRLPASAG